MSFVHLHTHSHYSLLDGLPKIDELINKALTYQMPALALTDHGVMYGVVEFYQKAKKAGLKPIVGVEAYLAPNGRLNKRARIDEKPYHLILLAKNNLGYRNLLKLTSLAHLEGYYYKPRVDWELLEKYHQGLICCTACLQGEVPRKIMNHELDRAKETIIKYQQLFGAGNFYLEMQHRQNIPEQNLVNQQLINFSKELNVPLIATNDIHYLNSEDDQVQDILICLQTKKKKDDLNRLSYLGEDYSLLAPEVMAKNFAESPTAISNTLKIAESCDLVIELGKVYLPKFDLPDKTNPNDYLKELCLTGTARRYPNETEKPADFKDRLAYELEIIEKTGYADYFLIVQDFINWAKNNGIVVGPGRGSAAGSLVSYLLNITNIDPLKYNLLFERFLNPERISMPDIDTDFSDVRRDEVINYVEDKYNKDHVSQIITFGTMAARAAVRDVGRVLGYSYSYCDRLAKMIPFFSTLSEALAENSELKEIYENDPEAKKLIDFAKKLEGVARHASTHACGVLITKNPLTDYVPLQFASSDDKTIISQYSLHPIEDLGLLKMDFLGLKNLTIIEKALEIVEKTKGLKLTIDQVPLNDKKTFQLLRRGETTGVFQLESSGMRRYLKQLQPTELEDLIAMVSLYRPGPMELIPEYIAGKKGLKKITYLHPLLEPILSKTYGIAIYQEQIMQIARDLAGFTYGEADILRKAVGKKIHKLLREQEEKLIFNMVKNSIPEKTARKIWDFILPFASYGFNRSHAACYALIAYQTAYLKANFPGAFMAALLTSDQDSTERIAVEVTDCEKLGIKVLPPDINESFTTFTVVVSADPSKKIIRFGLKAIKNVGEHIAKIIIHERKSNGHYKNLEDFLTRVQDKDLNKKSLESLIKSGALDGFGERYQLLQNIEKLLTYSKKFSNGNQHNLFTSIPLIAVPTLKLEAAPPATKNMKLAWEKELLGLYISDHPLKEYEALIKNHATPIGELTKYLNKNTKIIGVITKIQKIITKSGQPMFFVNLEDNNGKCEALVFPKLLSETYSLWQENNIVSLTGRANDKEGAIKFMTDSIQLIDLEKLNHYLENNNQTAILIKLPENLSLTIKQQLKNLFSAHQGRLPVYLELGGKKVKTNYLINPSGEFKQLLSSLLGENSYVLLDNFSQ